LRAVFHLGVEQVAGGALDVRARRAVGPRAGVQAVAHQERHQVMVSRVVFDLVAPAAAAIVRMQARRVLVRGRAFPERFARAELGTERGEARARGLEPFARQVECRAQRRARGCRETGCSSRAAPAD
jgi:hypothetical protein